MIPTTSATKAQIPTASTGSVHPCWRMLYSRMRAAKTDTTASSVSAGRRACTSVYPAPLTYPSCELTSDQRWRM